MSSQVATKPEVVTPLPIAARLGDYLQLTRPRIGAMVLLTALLGMLLADVPVGASAVALMLLGTGLVTSGASAWNQLAEQRSDARMRRTQDRPLPAGRVTPGEVFAVGGLATLGGLVCLWFLPTGPAAALVAAATFVLYVFVYTPAKRRTSWNTWIGAVPGAMPPLIGWAAARGNLTAGAWPLFAILFFWQLPHFLAIAWIYRDDYRRAGLQMLPVLDATGRRTVWTMVLTTLALLATSLWPLAEGAGMLYGVVALTLGLAFLALAARFGLRRDQASARAVLRMSIVYLPLVFLMLFVDRLI
jgi:protoheme IX farnesyltransferase